MLEEPAKTEEQGRKVRRPPSRAGVPHGRDVIYTLKVGGILPMLPFACTAGGPLYALQFLAVPPARLRHAECPSLRGARPKGHFRTPRGTEKSAPKRERDT